MGFMKWATTPYKFAALDRYLRRPGASVLDVGCGTRSPSKTKSRYPGCVYDGLDMNREYGLDERDFALCRTFYMINLENISELAQIPDSSYDVVVSTHVIEHVHNSPAVILELCRKLKPGGVIYLETPSERSLRLPSMPGTLNFYDDGTHVHLWRMAELREVVERGGCTVLNSGYARMARRVILTPASYIYRRLTRQQPAIALWDITGFAHFVLAKRN